MIIHGCTDSRPFSNCQFMAGTLLQQHLCILVVRGKPAGKGLLQHGDLTEKPVLLRGLRVPGGPRLEQVALVQVQEQLQQLLLHALTQGEAGTGQQPAGTSHQPLLC